MIRRLFFPKLPQQKSAEDSAVEQITKEQFERQERRMTKRRRAFSIFFISYLIICFLIAQIGFQILNQSVRIWRVFHANLAICAPYLDESEENRFRARFAAVQTKAEFDAIQKELKEIADRNGSHLLPYELW